MLANAVHSLIYGISSRAVLLLINLFAVNLLIPAEYGAFSYFISIIASIATISSFGAGVATNATVARHLSSNPEFVRKVIYSSLILSTTLSLLISIAFIPLLKIPNEESGNLSWNTYAIVASLIWLMSFNGITEGTLNGAGEYKILATNAIVTFFIAVPLSLTLTWSLGFFGGILSVFIYRFLIAALNTYTMHRIGLLQLNMPLQTAFDKPVRDVFTGLSIPSALSGLMVAPVIAIAMRMVAMQENGLEEIAYFSWVYQIYLIGTFVPSALGGYFLSRFSSQQGTHHEFLKIFKINILFSSVVATILFLLKPLILHLAGDIYAKEAGTCFNILTFAIILYSANATFASYWHSRNKSWLGFHLNATWASVVLLISHFTAKQNGGAAIPLGMLCAYLVLLIIQTYLFNRQKTQESQSN